MRRELARTNLHVCRVQRVVEQLDGRWGRGAWTNLASLLRRTRKKSLSLLSSSIIITTSHTQLAASTSACTSSKHRARRALQMVLSIGAYLHLNLHLHWLATRTLRGNSWIRGSLQTGALATCFSTGVMGFMAVENCDQDESERLPGGAASWAAVQWFQCE